MSDNKTANADFSILEFGVDEKERVDKARAEKQTIKLLDNPVKNQEQIIGTDYMSIRAEDTIIERGTQEQNVPGIE